MKTKLTIASLLFIVIAAFTACKESNESNMLYIEQMKDSVFHTYPNVSSITIEVKDGAVLAISIVDKPLYNAADDKRQQRADELGRMALRIFPKETELDKGELHVALTDQNMTSGDNKESTIDILSIRGGATAQ